MYKTFSDVWKKRIEYMGSVALLADRLEVKRLQIYRWNSGEAPIRPHIEFLLKKLDEEIENGNQNKETLDF